MNIDTCSPSKLHAHPNLLTIECTINKKRQDQLTHYLYHGICEPSIVVDDGLEAIAVVQCQKLHTQLCVKFSKKMTAFLKENYHIKKGSPLLAVNTYMSEGETAADLENAHSFVNVHPIIAETLAASKTEVLKCHEELGSQYFQELRASFAQSAGKSSTYPRSAIPHLSAISGQDTSRYNNDSPISIQEDISFMNDESYLPPQRKSNSQPNNHNNGDLTFDEDSVEANQEEHNIEFDPYGDIPSGKPTGRKKLRGENLKHHAGRMSVRMGLIGIFSSFLAFMWMVLNISPSPQAHLGEFISAIVGLLIALAIKFYWFFLFFYVIRAMIMTGPSKLFFPFIFAIIITIGSGALAVTIALEIQ